MILLLENPKLAVFWLIIFVSIIRIY